MPSIMDMLSQQMGGGTLGKISQQLGTDEATTGKATSAAMSVLLGALARNASKGDGAESLHRALEKDHDGTILSDPVAAMADPAKMNADGILKHVLGSRRQQVEAGVGAATGLDAGKVGNLMGMLAPLVMGALGKAQREQKMGAGELKSFLGQQRQEVEKATPLGGGMLTSLLDVDGDGDVDMGDLAKGVMGKLFGR